LSTAEAPTGRAAKPHQRVERVAIRFAGDSGDGMQLTGTQFTRTTAVFGNDISTLPDYPAEIRAPAGSLGGVSGFQISFSSGDIHTPGDAPDVLVAMLTEMEKHLKPGGLDFSRTHPSPRSRIDDIGRRHDGGKSMAEVPARQARFLKTLGNI